MGHEGPAVLKLGNNLFLQPVESPSAGHQKEWRLKVLQPWLCPSFMYRLVIFQIAQLYFSSVNIFITACFRRERGEGFGGPTLGRAAERKTRKTRTKTATRNPAKKTRARRKTTAMKTTRLSVQERGGTVTEKGEARTPRPHPTKIYLPMTTLANTAVFQITQSWWVKSLKSHPHIFILKRDSNYNSKERLEYYPERF